MCRRKWPFLLLINQEEDTDSFICGLFVLYIHILPYKHLKLLTIAQKRGGSSKKSRGTLEQVLLNGVAGGGTA
jgi:hypothetical protein